MAKEELMDDYIGFRFPSEDRDLLERVIAYRYNQGVLQKQTRSEYARYCVNRDITEALTQIKQRRK